LDLANTTGGHLKVNDEGQVVFLFQRNIRYLLGMKSSRMRIWSFFQKSFDWIYYLFRISFGISLILSLVLVLIAIIVIIIAIESQGSNSRSGRSSTPSFNFRTQGWGHGHHQGFGLRPLSPMDIYWFLFWESEFRRQRRYQPVAVYERNNPNPDPRPHRSLAEIETGTPNNTKEMNFLEVIFSFLFGDGNPNKNF